LSEPAIHQVVTVSAPADQVVHQLLSGVGGRQVRAGDARATGPHAASQEDPGLGDRRGDPPVPVRAFAKEEDTVGIGVESIPGGGTRVTIIGQASKVLQSALQYVLSGYTATPAALPQNMYPVPAPHTPTQQWTPPPPPPPPVL